jgi:hypothetical protein
LLALLTEVLTAFKEIGVIDFVGRIAADNATAIPPHRMEANYNVRI